MGESRDVSKRAWTLLVALVSALVFTQVISISSGGDHPANAAGSSIQYDPSAGGGSGTSYPTLVPVPTYQTLVPPTSTTSTLAMVSGGTASTSTTLTPEPGATIEQVPRAGDVWPQCHFPADVYCWESAIEILADGTERPAPYGGAYAYCHRGKGFGDTEVCKTDGSFWFEIGYSNEFTAADLMTTYRWKVRMGKFSPDVLMLGDTQNVVVTGDGAKGWVIEISARPALKAYRSSCSSPTSCDDSTVAESVKYAIGGYLRTLGIGPTKGLAVETPELRDALRGTFISTNGMTQQWKFEADTFSVSAYGPHFLPDGKTVGPGYVKVFLPEAYVVKQRGYASLADIKPENLAVTVRGESVIPTIEIKSSGVLIDTGVRHYSDPNPSVKLLPGPLLPSPEPALLRRGKSIGLSSVYKKKVGEALRWAVRGQCVLRGAKVLALPKSGVCNVTASVKRGKKYVVVARKSLKIV